MQKILLFSHLFVSSKWKLLAKGAMTKRCFVLTFVAAGPDVMKNANPGYAGICMRVLRKACCRMWSIESHTSSEQKRFFSGLKEDERN